MKPERDEISELVEFSGITEVNRLRARTLQPLVWFYIAFNTALYVAVFVFAYLERYYTWYGEHIVTANVFIALVTGSTVQVAAMIIAAFKGLFDTKSDSDTFDAASTDASD